MLETTEDFSEVERFKKGLDAYKVASGRTLAFAMIKWGKELAFALYKETAKITPTESALIGLGGSTPSKPKSGEKPKKGLWAIRRTKGGAMDELHRRVHHRKFHAVGWIPAMKGFMHSTVHTNVRALGGVNALVNMAGEAHIILFNRAGVIAKVTRQHNLLHKAVSAVFRNAAPYIKKKLGEEARRAFWNLT